MKFLTTTKHKVVFLVVAAFLFIFSGLFVFVLSGKGAQEVQDEDTNNETDIEAGDEFNAHIVDSDMHEDTVVPDVGLKPVRYEEFMIARSSDSSKYCIDALQKGVIMYWCKDCNKERAEANPGVIFDTSMTLNNRYLAEEENRLSDYLDVVNMIEKKSDPPVPEVRYVALGVYCNDIFMYNPVELMPDSYPGVDEYRGLSGMIGMQAAPENIDDITWAVSVYAKKGDYIIRLRETFEASELFTNEEFLECSSDLGTNALSECLAGKLSWDHNQDDRVLISKMEDLIELFEL